MRIESAKFEKLHGYLDFDLKFEKGVNLIIGINGSGKTSILNSIAWTLSPNYVQGGYRAAYLLSALDFEQIDIGLGLSENQDTVHVTAVRKEGSILIKVTGIDAQLEIPVLLRPETNWFNRGRTVEESADYIDRFLDDQRANPVLEFLASLPGPLYLPLDRRWMEEADQAHHRRNHRPASTSHIPASVVLARASRAHRQQQARVLDLDGVLRNQMLTEMIASHNRGVTVPEVLDHQQLADLRFHVSSVLGNLGLPDAIEMVEVQFDHLGRFADTLGGREPPEDMTQDPEVAIWLDWAFNGLPITFRLQRLMPLIEKYESDRAGITRASDEFLGSINRFISDNGKFAHFLPDSELAIGLPNGQQINGDQLSSGELQLLILFTFLYFGFDSMDQEFPVLVDEPEMSLHLAWQNRYVDSVKAANPHAQFLIATHSPEITGLLVDAAIDISRPVYLHGQL